jgi:pyruvate/2-oxoglutarate dehydrogenase complex dihydrolipoamide acyltransferase (E2) component
MRSPIKLPDLGCPTPRLSVWYARPGDAVLAGERVVEILVENATVDLSSPDTGRLVECHARPDQLLTPGQLLAVIET